MRIRFRGIYLDLSRFWPCSIYGFLSPQDRSLSLRLLSSNETWSYGAYFHSYDHMFLYPFWLSGLDLHDTFHIFHQVSSICTSQFTNNAIVTVLVMNSATRYGTETQQTHYVNKPFLRSFPFFLSGHPCNQHRTYTIRSLNLIQFIWQ